MNRPGDLLFLAPAGAQINPEGSRTGFTTLYCMFYQLVTLAKRVSLSESQFPSVK